MYKELQKLLQLEDYKIVKIEERNENKRTGN